MGNMSAIETLREIRANFEAMRNELADTKAAGLRDAKLALAYKAELEAAKAEIKHLTEQMGKLAHLANEKNAVVISEMYIADWDVVRAETAQARTQLAVANARIAELEEGYEQKHENYVTAINERDTAHTRIAELEGARAAVCKWYPDDDCYWEGTCGVAWSLEDGTPRENDMNFCPKCGRKLIELPEEPEVKHE